MDQRVKLGCEKLRTNTNTWFSMKYRDQWKKLGFGGCKILRYDMVHKKESEWNFMWQVDIRGMQSEDREHYNSSFIHFTVTNDATISIKLALAIMANRKTWLIYGKVAFLHGQCHNGKKKIPKVFKNIHDEDWV